MMAWSQDDKLELEKLYIQEMRPVLNRRALFSDTTGEYVIPAEPKLYEKITIRFRAGRNNLDQVCIVINNQRLKMYKESHDEQFDYYAIQYQLGTEVIHYYFEMHVGMIFGYYDARGLVKETMERMWFRIVPGFSTPDWAKGIVMYQIYVDRFYNGDVANDVETKEYVYINDYSQKVEDWFKYPAQMGVREFYGGDLQGVLNKMDYLQELGVEAIYFNPLFVSPSNHKYDIQDYDYIDPHIGCIVEESGEVLQDGIMENRYATKYINRVTNKKNLEASNALFIKVVEEAHKRGMKVILDGVFNHCGSFNKWLDRERIYENAEGYDKGAHISPQSPYKSFFKFSEQEAWPYNKSYEGWWGHDTLPKLNYEESKELEEYILYIAQKWVSPPYNVDGWRLDVAADLGHSPEYNHEFWRKFRKKVKGANPDAIILAEHYGDTRAWLSGGEWDSVMNYHFYNGVMDFVANERIPASQFLQQLDFMKGKVHTKVYPILWNLIDSHDTARFLHSCGNSVKKQRLAAAFQLLMPGMPMIYYGDEYAMKGGADPDCRRGMVWKEERQNSKMFSWYKTLIWLRKEYPCITEGETIFCETQDDAGLIVIGKKLGDEEITIIFHGKKEALELPQFVGRHNLITQKPFSGKIAGYDVVVLQ